MGSLPFVFIHKGFLRHWHMHPIIVHKASMGMNWGRSSLTTE